jgi:hypothetical protein
MSYVFCTDVGLVDRIEDSEFVVSGGVRFGCILNEGPISDFAQWMQNHFASRGMAAYEVTLKKRIIDERGLHEEVLEEQRGSRSFVRAPRKFLRVIRHLPECRR